MFPNDPDPTVSETGPTQHAVLVVWGHFAQIIGLTDGWTGWWGTIRRWSTVRAVK